MAGEEIFICDAASVEEGGKGVRFPVTAGGEDCTAFVVRFDGVARAYLNRCTHVPMELDWSEGVFFDSSGLYLMCSTHGALYDPQDGSCRGGPCSGRGLHPMAVVERDGRLYWVADDYVRPALA